MIFERTILYSPYNPYSIYFRMAVYIYICNVCMYRLLVSSQEMKAAQKLQFVAATVYGSAG